MLAAALHDASRAWDVWSYHVPFAGRLGGVLPPSVYAFHPANQARFDGYPLLGELLQGLVWRVTGRVEATNLLAFASVPIFAWVMRARHGVAWPLTVIGALAIPLVHVHATSSYVDLPANVAATVLVMEAIAVHATREPVSRASLLVAGVAAAFAVNAKFQLHPFVLAAGVAFAWRAVPSVLARRDPREIAAIVCALPLVFFRPLENLVLHHNPYYPVRLEAFGVVLPGPETPYGAAPTWLRDWPRPARFVASLLEIGLRPMSSTRRWTVDQWMPDGADGARMGGFFHAYVVALLAMLALRAALDQSRRTRVMLVGFGLLTALASIVPQSHELRYYLVWMLALVAVNLVLARHGGPAWLGPRAVGVVSFAALAVVLAVTRGGYAYPWDPPRASWSPKRSTRRRSPGCPRAASSA